MIKPGERLPEVDWDEVFTIIGHVDEDVSYDKVREMIIQFQLDAWQAAHEQLIREGVTRSFLLDEKVRWLDQADAADGEVGRAVARFVANAYGEAAERLRRPDRPTLDDPSTDDLPSLEESSQDPDRCAHGFPMGLHCNRDTNQDTPVSHVIVTQFCGLDDPHKDHGYGAGLDERWCPGT